MSGSSLRRGITYYRQGAVTAVKLDGLTISGSVSGSQPLPYKTSITLGADGIKKDACSCPLGGSCKHVVALAIAALTELPESEGGELQVDGTSQPAWERSIKSLLQVRDEVEPSSSSPQHQLQLALRHIEYTSGGTALELRPRGLSPATNRSSFSNVGWASPHYGVDDLANRYSLSSEQAFFLWQLSAILELGYRSKGWVAVADTQLGNLWPILLGAPECNVLVLYNGEENVPVTISNQPITRRLVLAETKRGNAAVRVELFVGSSTDQLIPLVKHSATIFGDPPRLALLTDSATDTLSLRQVQDGSVFVPQLDQPIVIPKQEIKTFQARYAHQLAVGYGLTATTDAIAIPKVGAPKAAIDISTRKAKEPTLQVRLGWRYDKKSLPLIHTQEEISQRPHLVIPDRAKEQELIDILAAQFTDVRQSWGEDGELLSSFQVSGMAAAHFMHHHIAVLQQHPEVMITTTDSVPDFLADKSDPEIKFHVDESGADKDWFNLNIGVNISGEEVPFTDLFIALHENQDSFMLPSGRYFSLQQGAFDQLRRLIKESHAISDHGTSAMRLSRYQTDYWADLESLGIASAQSKLWRSHVQRMSRTFTTMYQPPRQLQATLRDYQLTGYSWLRFLFVNKLGGVLGDDMGLGKTVQMIGLIVSQVKKNSLPFLIIAPTSVVETWQDELTKFAPQLRVVIMRSGDRTHLYDAISTSDVIVTSYALLRRDFKQLAKQEFAAVVLDEAQAVKNYQSKSFSLIKQLQTDVRFAMTGTPMENNTMELWALFAIVAPGLFGDPKKFREQWQNPIEKQFDQQVLSRLQSRMRPFLLRRTKEAVAKELPPKTIQTQLLEMDTRHKHVYDLHLQRERKKVLGLLAEGGLQNHRFEILKSITRLRQLSLHPGLLNPSDDDIPNAKLNEMIRQLQEISAEGHKALVFSQFTSFLRYVQESLQQHGLPYLYLDGSTKKRGALVARFQDQASPEKIFVISIKAGGSGLNLTAADYCFILDPWWNPAVEMQAIDRTHRIGQDKHVHVYKLISKDTIEEKVLKLQEKKQKLFNSVLNNTGSFSGGITDEDIRMILA